MKFTESVRASWSGVYVSAPQGSAKAPAAKAPAAKAPAAKAPAAKAPAAKAAAPSSSIGGGMTDVEAQAEKIKAMKASGKGNKDPDVIEAVKVLKELKAAQPAGASAAAVGAKDDEKKAEKEAVKNPKVDAKAARLAAR